jgi:DNA polymerase-3 subunit beta
MKVTAPRAALLSLVDACRACTGKKSAMPILENLLLVAEPLAIGAKLKIAGTDLYITLSGIVGAEVDKPGSIAIQGAGLAERIRMMPDGPVEIVVKDARVEIRAPGSQRHFFMPCSSSTEFPTLPEPGVDGVKTKIAVALLETLIAKTSFAISLDSTRPHVNSLFLKLGKTHLTAVATDGHRLAKASVLFAEAAGEDDWLIPLEAVQRLREFLAAVPRPKKKGDEAAAGPATVTMQKSKSTVFFTSEDRIFSFKLVDAQFPPYDQVIPQRDTPPILAPREALIGAIRAVALSAAAKTGGVKIACHDGKILVSVDDSEKGMASDEVVIETTDQQHRLVGINAKYMIDAFGAVDTERVSILMDGELDPILIRPEGASEVTLDLVVMPMRI